MGIIRSKPKSVNYPDTYHITDTFSNHVEWKHTVKRMNRIHGSFFYERVNLPEVFGSQPYVIYAVYGNESKEDIKHAAYEQPHITVCNCIFIFCARSDFRLVTDMDIVSSTEHQSFFQRYIYNWGSYSSIPLQWAIRQTYMALGFVIAACAEESIPCYPVDTFNADMLSIILELPSHLKPTAILTIGAQD
jgi:nitroreductase